MAWTSNENPYAFSGLGHSFCVHGTKSKCKQSFSLGWILVTYIVICLTQDKAWTEQYLWALFKALSHMLCIGYGRHPPQNIPETCVTISSMMTGATFYALFIAYSINVIQTMDSPGRNYREKVRSVCSQVATVLIYSRNVPIPFQVFGLICNLLRHLYNQTFHSISPARGSTSS